MSKIGRRPIFIGNVKIEIKGQEVHFEGSKASGVYVVPEVLEVSLIDSQIKLFPRKFGDSSLARVWGLHRAILANKIEGADKGFEKKIRIVGLGYKTVKRGDGLEFSLGFSHKIELPIPKDVSVDLDKTGQLLTVRSFDKELLGLVCSKICDLRPVEPYKGTGVYRVGDVVRRKAGKAKV